MGKRELRAAIKRLLKNTDLTWEETQAILAALAGLHGELRRLLLESGLYRPAEIGRLLANLEAITTDYARQIVVANQAATLRAWQRGISGFDDLVGAAELTWSPGLTGLESELVRQFLTTSRIVSVTEEMRAAIRGQIVSGVMMESTPFEVMSAITNILGIRDLRGFREIGTTGISAKAEAIMRTELLTVQSAASWTGMADAKNRFPDLEQVWLATGDNRTRWEHIIAHGQRVTVGEPFIVGGEKARFPRDPSLSPGNRINCRCDAIPFRAEWGEQDDLIGPLSKQIEEERKRREEERRKQKQESIQSILYRSHRWTRVDADRI